MIIALLVFQGEDESADNPGTTVGATHDEKSGNRDVERDEQRDDSAKDRHSDAVALQDADSERGRVEENAEANGGRGAALDSDDDDDDDASDHDDRDDADDAAADPALKDNGSDSANAAGTDKAEDALAQAAGTDPTSLGRENASDQGSSDRAAQPSENKAATAPTEVARHHADAKSDTAAKTTSRTRSSSKNNAASDLRPSHRRGREVKPLRFRWLLCLDRRSRRFAPAKSMKRARLLHRRSNPRQMIPESIRLRQGLRRKRGIMIRPLPISRRRNRRIRGNRRIGKNWERISRAVARLQKPERRIRRLMISWILNRRKRSNC